VASLAILVQPPAGRLGLRDHGAGGLGVARRRPDERLWIRHGRPSHSTSHRTAMVVAGRRRHHPWATVPAVARRAGTETPGVRCVHCVRNAPWPWRVRHVGGGAYLTFRASAASDPSRVISLAERMRGWATSLTWLKDATLAHADR